MLLRRDLLAGLAALSAGPVLAQTAPSADPGPTPAAVPAPRLTRVNITTRLGVIGIALEVERAPITAANFLKYVDQKRFDHASFYRASRPGDATDYGVVQGGLQNDPKWLLPPIKHESTTKTGVKHTDGVISMGRRAPGTATADWFICVGDQSYLDADPSQPGDNKGFAAFGHVVEGMEVVKQILVLPRSPTAGVGVMKGEMLKPPLPILKIRRA